MKITTATIAEENDGTTTISVVSGAESGYLGPTGPPWLGAAPYAHPTPCPECVHGRWIESREAMKEKHSTLRRKNLNDSYERIPERKKHEWPANKAAIEKGIAEAGRLEDERQRALQKMIREAKRRAA